MKKVTILILFITLILGINGIKVFATVDSDDLGYLRYYIDNPNANEGSTDDQFGYSFDTNDKYIIANTNYEDIPTTNSGVVYIFDITDGTLLSTIINPNFMLTADNDNFGKNVLIGDDYAVIGSFGEDFPATNSGILYVYDISDIEHPILWRTIINPNFYSTSNSDGFSYPMALHGTTLLVSALAEDDDDGWTSIGIVYVFDIYTGVLIDTIENPSNFGSTADDQFGFSLDLNDDYIIIGTPYEDERFDGSYGASSGSVYIFDIDDRSLLTYIPNPNSTTNGAGDNFGYDISITDDYFVVTAPTTEDTNNYSGVAYIFDITDFSLLTTIANPNDFNTSYMDLFGYDVDTFKNYAVIGAHREEVVGDDLGTDYDSGVAYVFDLIDGSLIETIRNPFTYGGGSSDYFGFSVGMSNNNIVVSTYKDNSYNGVIYVFEGILVLSEYTITFESNGGNAVADITQDETTTLTPPDDPTKDGYSFVGWYSDIFLINEYTFSDFPSENITLYARWVEGGSGGSAVGGLTNNFMFMLVAIILYLTMLFLRFTTGVRIWNLFGVGILIYFIIQFSSVIPMVIVLIGFIIYQLYDTFLGGK